jgi:DNA polymerase V
LQEKGIQTALQLRDADPGLIRQKMGVVGIRLQQELQGISCLPLQLCPAPKQETSVSRSFGRPVTDLGELKEAIALYTSRAAEKLRYQRQAATVLRVFARSSPHQQDPYYRCRTLELAVASNDTMELVYLALQEAEYLFSEGVVFQKAGVTLMGLVPSDQIQGSLFDTRNRQKSQQLMRTVDQLNRRFGSGTLQIAAAGIQPSWSMKRQNCSPRYTTCWGDLPRVATVPEPLSLE